MYIMKSKILHFLKVFRLSQKRSKRCFQSTAKNNDRNIDILIILLYYSPTLPDWLYII